MKGGKGKVESLDKVAVWRTRGKGKKKLEIKNVWMKVGRSGERIGEAFLQFTPEDDMEFQCSDGDKRPPRLRF